uniref:C-type lectin domain-containing protein n=1 Tax=Plectus sambesii TaxID=2011161 RepID=A0A914XG00_9BILA
MDISIALLIVYIAGSILALIGLIGCIVSYKYTVEKKQKTSFSTYLLIFISLEIVIGAFMFGNFEVVGIAQQSCASPPTPASWTGNGTYDESAFMGRKSGANMTCAKGESNSFVLALQSGRRCIQYLSPDTIKADGYWEEAMNECNKRGGYLPHFYNSIDVDKVTKWIPILLSAFPRMARLQGWAGHRATNVAAYKNRNMAEIAWYIDTSTTIGINLDVMEQEQISWPVLPNWGGDAIQAFVGKFYVTVPGMEGIPMWFNNENSETVFCEYQNPEYVAEFKKYGSKRSPAPVFESHINPDESCDQICSKYPHCMGFNVITIALDKYQCDLVAFTMIDLVNATLEDNKYSTYYNLIIE